MSTTTTAPTEAELLGELAWRSGKSPKSCPYTEGRNLYLWQVGWQRSEMWSRTTSDQRNDESGGKMSGTTTFIPPIGGPNVTTGAPTTAADQAIGLARNVPDLISKASTLDPDLAAKWTGTALLQSKTFWGSLGVLVASAIVKRYSLGWDENTVDLVVGSVDLAAFAALRSITEHPITGWLLAATPAEAIAKLPAAVAP